ncbi:MAG: hypothetical protein HY329_04920 [Chloroflexi bacterium]|nr:hypothetical protein [Chloroflexota bacterium]
MTILLHEPSHRRSVTVWSRASALLIGAALLSACGGSAPTASQSAPATSAQTPTSSSAAAGEGDIKKMGAAWSAAKSYRLRMEGKDGQGNQVELNQEVVRPDRERLKMSNAGQSVEMIVIGSDVFVNAAGQWIKAPTGVQRPASLDPGEMIKEIDATVAKTDGVTKGGVVTVGSDRCQEWVLTGSKPDDAGTMCVGLADNLPRQFKAKDGSVTMTFSDWNAAIKIDPPI